MTPDQARRIRELAALAGQVAARQKARDVARAAWDASEAEEAEAIRAAAERKRARRKDLDRSEHALGQAQHAAAELLVQAVPTEVRIAADRAAAAVRQAEVRLVTLEQDVERLDARLKLLKRKGAKAEAVSEERSRLVKLRETAALARAELAKLRRAEADARAAVQQALARALKRAG